MENVMETVYMTLHQKLLSIHNFYYLSLHDLTKSDDGTFSSPE